jgi:hypothetical protein
LTVLAGDSAELDAMADFMARYANADLADVALAFAIDRERIYNILTVDRKDFHRYRSPAGKRLRRLWLKD